MSRSDMRWRRCGVGQGATSDSPDVGEDVELGLRRGAVHAEHRGLGVDDGVDDPLSTQDGVLRVEAADDGGGHVSAAPFGSSASCIGGGVGAAARLRDQVADG